MILRPLELEGAFLVEIEPAQDERGFYARSFDAREFAERGLVTAFVEAGTSLNSRRGTVRGMHMQLEPHPQAKLVRCTRGAIHDVIVDLRDGSPTHGRWVATRLSSAEGNQLYVPAGFAHGFQTLEDGVEVSYQLSDHYDPGAEFGVRCNDPRFGIDWPIEGVVISDRDRSFPDFEA